MTEFIKKLTIVMPTYNRKDRMLNQLSSIYKYGDLSYYYLVIVDNCSNYDVMEAIKDRFPKDFVDNIEYHRNTINTHVCYNTAMCFLYAKSKYLMQISDDDEYPEGFMDTIKQYISKYPNVLCIQFALSKPNLNFDDIFVNSLKEFDSLLFKQLIPGDCLFIGNKVYNMEALHSYSSDCFIYSYTGSLFLPPILHALWDNAGTVVISSQKLCNYLPPADSGWNLLRIALGMATIYDCDWSDGTNYSQIKYVRNIMAGHIVIQMPRLLRLLLNLENGYRSYVFHRLMSTIFKGWWKDPFKWYYLLIYHIEVITRIPLLSKLQLWLVEGKKQFVNKQKDTNGIIYRLYKKQSLLTNNK